MTEQQRRQRARFVFNGAAVLELVTHAKAAPRNISPYGLTENPGPGVMLVKDDGVYLMSNGEPPLPGTDTANKVVYAQGYEALPATASVEERMAQYDKIRDAAGGDDFAEFIPAKSLSALEPEGELQIELSVDKMTVSVVRPPLAPIANKKGKRR
ncbi:MAG: DUF3085 domain-containing protein [Edaphobacter sp.]